MIEGVTINPLRKIPDDRGAVWHMLKATDPVFEKFGEIYFSTIYPGIIKGWHKHRKMNLNYACIVGMVKVVLFDDRKSSATGGQIEEYYIGESNYSLLHIPHGVTNGMQGLGTSMSIVANCATLVHDPGEMIRIDPTKADISYDWTVRSR